MFHAGSDDEPRELGDEFGPLVSMTMDATDDDSDWSAAGAAAARKLFDYRISRALRDPGRHVHFTFPVGNTLRSTKIESAIAAFNAEWARLVPGWAPPENMSCGYAAEKDPS